ncbi:hypothetical protein H312_00237 [Anncaliia algerae PRA339]|uniref:Uncharacterized protein n=1 Tax=Anncaliia algerae PRA339 TaxID=1288291 RepID=A0A059F5F1_9MICR|nr:hypothetical protein H312_00237 [Anncaliia algerae PRA339]
MENKNTRSIKQPKVEKYNEKKTLQRFLNSPMGISFLTEKANDAKINNFVQNKRKKYSYEKIINEVLDFYFTWSENIPIRRDGLCYYEMFKVIEKNCDEKEVRELFNYLIK